MPHLTLHSSCDNCNQLPDAQNQFPAQSGQIGLITLLIMAVIVTISFSLSQRTIQQQDAAFIQDESTRVFSNTESGIEEALSKIAEEEAAGSTSGSWSASGGDNSSWEVAASDQFEMGVTQDKTVEIPLDGSAGNITIQWWYNQAANCNGSNPPPAIITHTLNESSSTFLAFDPCETERNTSFSDIISSGSDDYSYSVTVSIAADNSLFRVKPIFNDTRFKINGQPIDYAQYDVSSTAYLEEEDLARSVDVKRSALGNHSFMDYTLVSGSSLEKN